MLKILIVKDESSSQHDLTTLGSRFQELARFRHAGDLDTALDYLDRGDVSCILLDSSLTDVDGRDVYETLRGKYPQIPLLLLVGKDGNTRLLNADGMSFHVLPDTSATELFQQIVGVVERLGPRLSVPTALEHGRLGPDATTKPPRNPPLPVDIVEAATSPSGDPEEPIGDLASRVRAVEQQVISVARDLRFLTWVVAALTLLGVVQLLR